MGVLKKIFGLFLREKETKNEEPRVRFLKPGESSRNASGELRDVMLAQNYPGDMGKEVQTVIVDSTGKPVNAPKPKTAPVNTQRPKTAPANTSKPKTTPVNTQRPKTAPANTSQPKTAPTNTPKPKAATANAPKSQAAPVNTPNQNPDTSSFELEKRYGSISREAYSTGKWNTAKFRFKNLEKEGLIEASIALGQMAQMTDKMEALEHFRKAAAKGSAEGAWSVAALLGHSYKAEINGKDKEWYKYCLQAAQGGCSDAMNELGNMYNRINDYLGAYYWYQMATYYEHPQGMDGVNGIIKKYVDAGMPKLTPKIDGVRPNDAQNAIFILRVLTGQDRLDNDRMNAFMAFAMADDNEIMCLFIAQFFESVVKMDGNAKMGYQLAAHNNSIMGMKCLADMLMAGKGCERNVESAIDWYIAAADKEEKTACFMVGEITRPQDPELADFFYSVAYRRGYEPALARLQRK